MGSKAPFPVMADISNHTFVSPFREWIPSAMGVERRTGMSQDQSHTRIGLTVVTNLLLVHRVRESTTLDHVEQDDQFFLMCDSYVLLGQELLNLCLPGIHIRGEVLIHLEAHHGKTANLLSHLFRIHMRRNDQQRSRVRVFGNLYSDVLTGREP